MIFDGIQNQAAHQHQKSGQGHGNGADQGGETGYQTRPVIFNEDRQEKYRRHKKTK